MEIKIIKTPVRNLPDWICKAWVGKILPVHDELSSEYSVEANAALDVLKEKSPGAEQWFSTNTQTGRLEWFFFEKNICELVS